MSNCLISSEARKTPGDIPGCLPQKLPIYEKAGVSPRFLRVSFCKALVEAIYV